MLDCQLYASLSCARRYSPRYILVVAAVLCAAIWLTGNAAHAQGQYPRTIACVSAPTAPLVVNLEQIRQQAQQAYQTTQFDQSLHCYRQIVGSGAASSADYYWLAQSYTRIGHFASAAQSLEAAIKLDAANDLLRVRLVESYFAAKDRSAAQLACQKGLATVRDSRAREQLAILHRIIQMPEPELVRGKVNDPNAISTER